MMKNGDDMLHATRRRFLIDAAALAHTTTASGSSLWMRLTITFAIAQDAAAATTSRNPTRVDGGK